MKWSSFFPVKKEKNRMTVRKQQGANCVVFSFNLNLKYNPFSTAVQNVFVCLCVFNLRYLSKQNKSVLSFGLHFFFSSLLNETCIIMVTVMLCVLLLYNVYLHYDFFYLQFPPRPNQPRSFGFSSFSSSSSFVSCK